MNNCRSARLVSVVIALCTVLGGAAGCRAQPNLLWDDLARLEGQQDWAAIDRRLQAAPADVRGDYKFSYYQTVVLYHTQRLGEGDGERDRCLAEARAQGQDVSHLQDRLAAARSHAIATSTPPTTAQRAEPAPEPAPPREPVAERVTGDSKVDKVGP